MTTRLADATTTATGILAAASWLPDVEMVLRIGATCVAIGAGLCAGLYHFEAWRQKRRERLNGNPPQA